jgi:hypothetical protein
MPACRSAAIDVSDVETAIAHPDVQAAFANAAAPFFGNSGVADAPEFLFSRLDGRGFRIGLECTQAGTLCVPTPPGIKALVTLVRSLVTQQLADAACEAAR